MDQTAAFLSLIAMFTMVILLVGVLYSRLHWAAKAAFIVLSMGMSLLSFHTYRESRGWAVEVAKPPELFQFVGGVAREPVPSRGDAGALFFWIVEQGQTEPRAIKLPYSRENHKKMEQAKQRAGKGETVYMGQKAEDGGKGGKEGKAQGTGGQGQGSENGKPGRGNGRGNSAGQGGGGGRDPESGTIDFVIPPSNAPDKG